MDAYGKMDKDLRRLVKRAIKSGLENYDGAIRKAENGEYDAEMRANTAMSAGDDFDANADN